MRLSHLNALRALDATLRHGSFTDASKELGITPAAVGQRVRALEQYLGKDLFVRSSTGIEPTEEARSVDDLLTDGFTKIAQALGKLSPENLQNILRLTLPESFSENWLAPILSEFHLDNPNVELHLTPTNRDEDLLAGNYDLAIRYGSTNDGPFEERVLFGDFVIPVCSPEFALRHKLKPKLRSLEGVPLIHITHRTKDPGWVGFERWGEAFGFDRAHLGHGVWISKTGSGLQAAIAGQGLVLCGIVEAFSALRAGALVLPFGPSVGFQTRYAYRLVRVSSHSEFDHQKRFSEWVSKKSAAFESELTRYLSHDQIMEN